MCIEREMGMSYYVFGCHDVTALADGSDAFAWIFDQTLPAGWNGPRFAKAAAGVRRNHESDTVGNRNTPRVTFIFNAEMLKKRCSLIFYLNCGQRNVE